MMPFGLLINTTVSLAVALVLARVSRRLPAAAKHTIYISALSLSLLLPLANFAHVPEAPALFTVTIRSGSTLQDALPASRWLVAVWACGACAVLLRFFAGLAYLAWQTRFASTPISSAKPRLRSADISTPVVWGWIRPTILVPRSFPNWGARKQGAVLAHEHAHIDRHDCWTALVAMAAQAAYWFHPMVWWVSKELAREREFATDDRVIANGFEALEYAGFLVETARNLPGRTLFGCAMMTSRSELRGRVERLLTATKPCSVTRSRLTAFLSIAVLILSAFVLPAKARFADHTYTIGGDILPPSLVYKVEPKYTRKSKREKIQGLVLLNLIVDKDGRAHDVRVEKSLTPDLDQQAIRAVHSWRFKPAMKNGQPVAVQAKVEVQFRLL